MAHDAAAPRRHPEQGGYARGEETRARIIGAALRVFGEQGYDQASTRGIAAEAGVNPPALQYYFDSKEGLHRACAQHIIDRVSEVLSPAQDAARDALRGRQAACAREALLGLLDAVADGLVAAGSESWSRFIARGKADGAGPAMAMIHERIGVPLLETLAQLIALATGRSAQHEETRLRALAVLGEVHAFHSSRDNALSFLRWPQLDEQRLARVKAVVRAHATAALEAATLPTRDVRLVRRRSRARVKRA